MNRKVLVIALLSYCVIALWGCAAISKKDKEKPASSQFLEPQVALKFSDIPIPAGFKPLPQNSYFFESGGVRVGLLKYQGKADVDRIVDFYKEQMPLYNWNLLNVVEYGEYLLNFERERETCIVTLASKGNNVTITISFGPKSQIPKKASKPVK